MQGQAHVLRPIAISLRHCEKIQERHGDIDSHGQSTRVLFLETSKCLSSLSIPYNNFVQPKALLIHHVKGSNVFPISRTPWVIHVLYMSCGEKSNFLQCNK